MVHYEFELLSHLNLNISFKTLEIFIPNASLLDFPRVRVCELSKHLYMLMLPDLLMIALHGFEINSGLKYSHLFVPPDLPELPELPDGLGHDHGGSDGILLYPLLHCPLDLYVDE